MEELKEAAVQEAVADAGDGGGKRKFALPALSRRTRILAVAGFLTLVLAVGGLFAYRAGAEKKKAVAELAAQAKREREVRAADERAEMARLAEEMRRSHREILETSPPASALAPAAAPALKETAALPPLAAPMPPPEPAAAATALPAKVPVAAEAPAREPTKKAAAAVVAPEASGGCTLSGKAADDYGKALARCLEEYNRIEGRARDGVAPQRR